MADFIDISDNKLRTAVINEYSRLICASNRSHREQKELRNRLITEALANPVDSRFISPPLMVSRLPK